MRKITIILTFALITIPLQAQDITNKLGGDTANETYDVTDSADNVLFRVQGDGKVGIGTIIPDATLDVHGTVKVLGDWDNATYTTETVYQAATDGFVNAYFSNSTLNEHVTIEGLTDSSDPPTTTRALTNSNMTLGDTEYVYIIFPVKKGDYWKITDRIGGSNSDNRSVQWIPLGQ